MAKKPFKKYTVACREEYQDGHDFVVVEARSALEAKRKAKQQYKKQLKKDSGEQPHEVYTEYIFPGEVKCIYNENAFGLSDVELKKL